MIENIRSVSNPLTIIAIFAGLAEVAGTVVLAFLPPQLQGIFLWYVIGFPIGLVIAFFVTLNFNATVLYAPSDFKDEEMYLRSLELKLRIKGKFDAVSSGIELAKSNAAELLGDDGDEIALQHKMEALNSQIVDLQRKFAEAQVSASEAVTDEVVRPARGALTPKVLHCLATVSEPLSMEEIALRTNASLPSLRATMMRLVQSGFALVRSEERGEPTAGRPRRVYSLTPKGRAAIESE